ncbi:MAG: cytochrome c [Oligoflexales bacterium]
MRFKIMVFITAMGIASVMTNCSTKEDKKEESQETTAGLSSTFKSRCSTCHGTTGNTAPPGATVILKGTDLSLDEFKETVRSGRDGTTMVSFSTSTYSDGSLEADYEILTE